MSSSCQNLIAALKDCLKHSDCVMKDGNRPSDCLKYHLDELPEECQSLRKATYECKRGMLDMRKRFRGNMIGSQFEFTPKPPPDTAVSLLSPLPSYPAQVSLHNAFLHQAHLTVHCPYSQRGAGLNIPRGAEIINPSIDYDVEKINFAQNTQKEPWFIKLNPNGRIPTIIDRSRNNFAVFETAAINLYLAQHYDKGYVFWFDPTKEPDNYSEMLQWIFFAHGGVGPMQGQANHFNKFAPEDIPYAKKRYTEETKRLFGVLEIRLKDRDYLAGSGRGKYSLADIKAFPWPGSHAAKRGLLLKSDCKLERPTIGDPFDAGSSSVPMSHPRDPSGSSSGSSTSSSSSSSPSSSSVPPPTGGESPNMPTVASEMSTSYKVEPSFRSPTYSSPPFHTHAFFAALEKTFPEETARSLMRATRALLVDRIGRVRREGLTVKDLDNQAYLFRAALSELRAEMTMNTKNDSAAIRAATAALRREVDRLDVKMKEDIGNLKHEIQMELDSRKNEAKADRRQQDVSIEELMNKAVVNVSDLRTDVEEIKWDTMRKVVLTLSTLVVIIIVMMEVQPKSKPPKNLPPPPRPEVTIPTEGLERTEWVT
ncbi:hypothetical protein NLJ89_g4760 [Agrocybe chaxingu]|uniref:Uncharacterized protein n=1 Tax=Agrocybe chaxingu TaxID=84603 RepID=A0A9W8K2M0_9AGAR|nr:hypothetical protein NLJ89_g4760 [Agrocybe chaxingu]